jgi:predicted amidohydrolase YtcJ
MWQVSHIALPILGLAGGSDWSVSSLNPLEAIEVGITHKIPGDSTGKPWNPAERVDLPTMLALYTINAAWALHQEKETGSIEVGKLADLVVLDRNLFEIPANDIHQARVTRTLLEGKTVYEDGCVPGAASCGVGPPLLSQMSQTGSSSVRR